MPTLHDIAAQYFHVAWEVRGIGDSGRLAELPTLDSLRPLDSLTRNAGDLSEVDVTVGDNSWRAGDPQRFAHASASTAIFRTHPFEQDFYPATSRPLAGDEELDLLLPRLENVRAAEGLKVSLRSVGSRRSKRVAVDLESTFDNTMTIRGRLADHSRLKAMLWFERGESVWHLRYFIAVAAALPTKAMFADNFDGGIDTLQIGRLLWVASSRRIPSTATTIAIKRGTHHYIPFAFGPHLQAAVRQLSPLVLLHSTKHPSHWRSSPFGLEFSHVNLPKCVLSIQPSTTAEGAHEGAVILHAQAATANGQELWSQLGSDDGIQRWNTRLPLEAWYTPPAEPENDADTATVGGPSEEEYYRCLEFKFPQLNLADFDAWMGGDSRWRASEPLAPIYTSLSSPQLIHVQFGVHLPTRSTTDMAIMFRGRPEVLIGPEWPLYDRSLFRIAIGQPFNPALRRVTHESHLALSFLGIACEGHFEPSKTEVVASFRPVNAAHNELLAQHFGRTTLFPGSEPENFQLRLNYTTRNWALSVD